MKTDDPINDELLKSSSMSVIIPTKNRTQDLQQTIGTLLAQTRLAHELIIVDQSQTQSVIDAGLLPLKHIYNPRITGLCQARNVGMKQATGDIWLFLDDDVLLEPDFIEKLLTAYRPDVTGVSGVVTNYLPPPILQRVWEFLFEAGPFRDDRQSVYRNAENLRNSPPVQVRKLGGGLMSFRANKIRGLRFDENLHGACFGEDIDFCAALTRGSVLLITPQARLVHKRSPEGRSQVHWLDLHAQGTNYMRQRHWRSGFRNNLCFAWLNVGYALAATLSTLKRRSLDPWRAWQSGAQRGAGLAAGSAQS
jgi:glycosyltransferase involved in cell wall biosynthesis